MALDQRARAGEDRYGQLRDATLLLAAVLACIYALEAANVIGIAPVQGGVLVGIAVLQAAWLIAVRSLRRDALLIGVVLNVLLVGLWVLSRTAGLPGVAGGPQPVGLLDAMCACDSIALIVLTIALFRVLGRGRPPRLAVQPLICAVVLAVGSLSALHAHGTAGPGSLTAGVAHGATAGERYHFFCQLL